MAAYYYYEVHIIAAYYYYHEVHITRKVSPSLSLMGTISQYGAKECTMYMAMPTSDAPFADH